MQEQRARDTSVLDERFSKVSGLRSGEQTTRTDRAGHKNHKKQPPNGSNQNERLEVQNRATQGTMVVYKERKADHQPAEGSAGKGIEGKLKPAADVDRETVVNRRSRDTNDEGTVELPESPHERDCDSTSSPSKGALVIHQGKKPRDGNPGRLRKTYHRKGSDATSMSQGGASVTHEGKEERDDATKQLPGRYGADFVDTIDSQTGALVIWREEKPEDESAEELPKQVGRRVTERDTNLVDFGEMSCDNRGRGLRGTSINLGWPHGEDDSYGSNFVEKDLSLENDPEVSSDGIVWPERDRRASLGGFRESVSDGDITVRRAEQRILDTSRTDRFDSDISPSSDNGTSSDNSKYSFSSDRPRDRLDTRDPIRKYENKLPSSSGPRSADEIPFAPENPEDAILRRRKGKHFQRKDADPWKFTKRRARAGRQQTTDSNNNGHEYIYPNSAGLAGSDGHHPPRPNSTMAGSSQLLRGKGSPADIGMRTLLVYRAALFAALCALAADTSCDYETELGRRIVQVL